MGVEPQPTPFEYTTAYSVQSVDCQRTGGVLAVTTINTPGSRLASAQRWTKLSVETQPNIKHLALVRGAKAMTMSTYTFRFYQLINTFIRDKTQSSC